MLVVLFVLLISSATANFHLETFRQLVLAHVPGANDTFANQTSLRHSVETARTNAAACTVTNFNRQFWNQKGGTSMLLLGNWEGVGTLELIYKPTATTIFTDTAVNTWNVTFQDGYIKWIDNFRPSSLPPSLGDTFSRYLQSDAQNEWYCCTEITSYTSVNKVDYELDVFNLPTSYSTLVDRTTGTHDAACTYHFETETNVIGSCTYYETLGVLPPGILLNYVIYLSKVSA